KDVVVVDERDRPRARVLADEEERQPEHHHDHRQIPRAVLRDGAGRSDLQGVHSARKRLVSPRALAPRLDANTSHRPSGLNIGKPSKLASRVTGFGSPPATGTM